MNLQTILRSTGLSISSLVALAALTAPAGAATFQVAAGDVAGLIAALDVAKANGQADNVILAAGSVYLLAGANNSTGGSPTGLPLVTGDGNSLTLTGQGATLRRATTAKSFRILEIGSDAAVAILDLTFEGGSSGADGGAILNRGRLAIHHGTFSQNRTTAGNGGGAIANLGVLAVDDSTFDQNESSNLGGAIFAGGSTQTTIVASGFTSNSAASSAGAIVSYGELSVDASHFSQNRAVTGYGGAIAVSGLALSITGTTFSANLSDFGGGVAVLSSTVATIDHSTLTLNEATVAGGGLYRLAPSTVRVRNTIVAGNVGSEVSGSLAAGSASNLLAGSARLGSLQDNGGPFPTHAPLPDSPAIDAGDDTIVTASTDGRGFGRISGLGVDIGAVELQQPMRLVSAAGSGQSTRVGTPFPALLEAAATEANGIPIRGLPITFSAPDSGATATFPNGGVATTDDSGKASLAVAANSVVGSYAAVARLDGVGTETEFSLTNLTGAAEVVTAVAGDGQSAELDTAFAVRLQARVTDRFGNPVAGLSVTFTVPSSGPSGAFGGPNVAQTDADGVAVAPVLTANDVDGGWSLIARGFGKPSLFTAFELTNVRADRVAPTVTAIEVLGSTAGGPLAECETVHHVRVTGFRLRFSEGMDDPAGDGDLGDVTHPASWRLVEAGPNASLDSASCSDLGGDDATMAISAVTYDGGSHTATLRLPAPLAAGRYRLLACGSGASALQDGADNALDGDGDGLGGDDFARSFRVDPGNLLANGHFDCNLEAWVLASTHPLEIVRSPDDADGSLDSGSARIENLTASRDFALGQCLPTSARADYDFLARVRLSSQTPNIAIERGCLFFAAPSCGGDELGSRLDASTLEDGAGAWVELGGSFSAPPGAASMLCSVSFIAASGASFEARVDQARLLPRAIFSDGFESGAPSAWSLATPAF